MDPFGGTDQSQALAQILKAIMGSRGSAGAAAPQTQGASPAPQATTNLSGLPTGLSIPGLTTMSSAQTGGPAARQMQMPSTKTWYHNPQEAKAASRQNTIQSLAGIVTQVKQQKWQKEAAQSGKIVTAKIAYDQAMEKQKSGQALTAQDTEAIKQWGLVQNDKNTAKILEKMQSDPMSGAYVGAQQAQQAAVEREMQQAKIEEQRQKAQAEQALAKQREAMAEWYKSRPATDAAKAEAAGEVADTRKAEAAAKQTEANNKLVSTNMMKGLHTEFDKDGKATVRPLTQTEIDADPTLKTQQAKEKAYTDAAVARVRQGDVKLQLERERIAQRDKEIAIKKQLADQGTAGIKLNTQDINRMSSAQMANDYLKEMKQIVTDHPNLFGPAGWGQNKIAKALASKDDPDYQAATRFVTLTDLTAQPLVAMHFRNAQALKEMKDLNSGFYQSPDVVLSRINTELEGTDRIRKTAGRPEEIQPEWMKKGVSGGGSKTTTPVAANPLGL
jgi:hypothetical protein